MSRVLALIAILLLPAQLQLGADSWQSDSLPPVDPLKMYSTTAREWDPADGLYYPPSENIHGFNPWTFVQNAAVLCGVDAPQLADELTMAMFHEIERGYIVHHHPYRFEDTVIQPDWVSGFSNGVSLIGASALYECYGGAHHRSVADLLFHGYVDGEFTEFLADGTIWFQEYPVADSRVLNGHIYAVLGLYYYYYATGNEEALPYLLGGLEAVAVHGWEYRRPGLVNLYDLHEPETADYGPARSIHQQDILCQITGDPRFLTLRDAFASDMVNEASDVVFGCTEDHVDSRMMSWSPDAA